MINLEAMHNNAYYYIIRPQVHSINNSWPHKINEVHTLTYCGKLSEPIFDATSYSNLESYYLLSCLLQMVWCAKIV